MQDFSVHGGRLSDAKRRFPGAPSPWVDLSTGVNPLVYPARAASACSRASLPDPAQTASLEAAGARSFGADPGSVLATAGAEAAIRLLAGALPVKRVAIVEPTYAGHRHAWVEAGASVVAIDRRDLQASAQAFDAVVVVNPNNPDGLTLPAEALIALAARLAAHDGWLIVDEAFIEVAPELSVAPRAGPEWASARLIALRSFGKFYGLPGVRLGFVTAHADLIAALRRRLGEWPVSADAIAAGEQAYADRRWAERMRGQLAHAARRLDAALVRSGLEVVGGTSLFRLAAADDAADRFVRLAQAGVLTRPFAYAPHWLRFGLPAPEHWPRLEAALMECAR